MHIYSQSQRRSVKQISEKQHACHQLEGETYTGTYGMVIFDHF